MVQKKEDYPEQKIEKEGVKKTMRYSELSKAAETLNDISQGKEIKVDHDTKIDLGVAGDYLKNVILDIDNKKSRTKEDIMHYRLSIEVNK